MVMTLYQVDAFTDRLFAGNPAAICPLEKWLDDTLMQQIAAENNLSETAFFVGSDGCYDLRWFTPTIEVDLCGHATLAAAHVVFCYLEPGADQVRFNSRSGPLLVKRDGGRLQMDFPVACMVKCEAPEGLIVGLGVTPSAVFKGQDYMVVLDHEQQLHALQPDFRVLAGLDLRGVIVTAPGMAVDFVSRFFAPNAGIDEDPVTGSAHCALTPYWVDRLNINPLRARQVSERGGELLCQLDDQRVILGGQCVTYLVAELLLEL